MHPVLRFIYWLLRSLSALGVYVFYRKRLVLGREHLRFEGPALVVSNHPSTLMDVLNLGIHIRQILFFLANYSLFKHPLSNWILTRLYCIPIKRKEDVDDGEDRNNEAAFEQSFRHLEGGGLLYVAPEGYSWMSRWVRPFKTGTARIAFGTEARHRFEAGVKIVPVGLSYDAANLFRSNMCVQYGAPLWAKDYRDVWEKDRQAAIDALTNDLEARVRALGIDTRDEPGERLIGRLEKLGAHARPLPPEPAFRRTQAWTARFLDDDELHNQTADYFGALAEGGLSDLGVQAYTEPGASGPTFAAGTIFLLLLFPLFALGYLFWFLPCFLPWLLARRLKLYIGYDSNVKFLGGLFLFPLALWGAYRFVKYLTSSILYGFLAIPAAIVAGYFVEWYLETAGRTIECLKTARFAKKYPEAWLDLAQQRNRILTRIF
jgi:glycerol-3-phosphate O-acyltransferase / dihydroxyacetone phosphate acyltransferase